MNNKILATVVAASTAEVTPLVNSVYSLHIPPIMMELFQCGAWGAAVIIAIIGAANYYNKNWRKYHKNDKKNEQNS